jgi:hypothetical protein
LAIVAFWAATTAWFFSRDLWPRFFADDRPPFSVNLEEETKAPPLPAYFITQHIDGQLERVGHAATAWDLYINGETAGEVLTLVRNADGHDGSYEVFTNQRLKNLRSLIRGIPLAEAIQGRATVENRIRVTPTGELLEMEAHALIDISSPQHLPLEVHVNGKLDSGWFSAAGTLQSKLGKVELKGEPVEMRTSQGFFDPTRPWGRLYDLQENRTWRVIYFNPALDSLMHSVTALMPGLGRQLQMPVLEGGVRSGTEDLLWDSRETPCQVIEYRGEGTSGKTFVRKSDGLVLRQEVEDEKFQVTMSLMRRPR